MASLDHASGLPPALRSSHLGGDGGGKRLGAILTPPRYSARTRTILSLLAIAGNTILITFFNGAITVALPSIAKSIDMPQNMLSWPLAMFSLTSGALLLFSGAMADAFGRRNVFLCGNVVFFLLCLAISFVTTTDAFIGCCAGLGIGAALLIPAGVGILGSSVPEGKMKNQSFAMLGAAQPTGFIIGLILGGLLSNRWQIIFWVLTAFAVGFGVCAFLGLPGDDEKLLSPSSSTADLVGQIHTPRHGDSTLSSAVPTAAMASVTSLPMAARGAAASDVPLTATNGESVRSLRLKTFDWFGAAMSTTGLIMLTFALADAESAPSGWRTSYVIALIVVSLFLLAAFQVWERRLERLQRTYELGSSGTAHLPVRNATFIRGPPTAPLLPPAIWRAPKFGAVIAVVFLAWAAFNVLSYFSTLVFQEVQRQSAMKTSLLFLPMIGAGLACNGFTGLVMGRVNALWLIVAGTALGAAAALIMSIGVDATTPYYKGMLWVIIFQVGPDLFFPAGNLYACKSLGRQHQALAGSLFNTTVRVATSLGLAISSTIATAVTKMHSHAPSPAAPMLERRGDAVASSPFLLLTRRAASSPMGEGVYTIEALMKGYQAAAWFCFACSLLSMAVAFAYLRNIGIVGDLETKEEKAIELSRPSSPAASGPASAKLASGSQHSAPPLSKDVAAVVVADEDGTRAVEKKERRHVDPARSR
ncbi:uncharacterized protein PFL1_01687 [Pseudozyma flocculosa PF-1]|uniref:Related to Cephamycin export protein cmcT n=1 Tax=Pseudozyma flocculosa TaxID=84751 RepID=A0A5C3F0Q4_9BASI|nr:uncharacterized protein PFL1_01687 [Pseudozyma flocculosa PF-1]EPQ30786.1 hypothetical protein PFL1_01687 [Pseudozyma flocculosa PF-1]SPO36851.1 related to Cephamycin export protein cmcT [Pseudozyma flocculosa]